MKSLFSKLICFAILATAACTPDDIGEQVRKVAEEKVRGEWKLRKITDDLYDPIPVFKSHTEYTGVPGDSYLFDSLNRVHISTQQTGQVEYGYEVINPTQVFIGEELWRIDSLDAGSLLLVRDRNKVDENRRYVTKIYLSK